MEGVLNGTDTIIRTDSPGLTSPLSIQIPQSAPDSRKFSKGFWTSAAIKVQTLENKRKPFSRFLFIFVDLIIAMTGLAYTYRKIKRPFFIFGTLQLGHFSLIFYQLSGIELPSSGSDGE